jgi:hypothetical protein
VANKISVIIDVAVDKANTSLKSFRTSIAEADGAAGKMKAGFAGLTSSIQANAGAIAVGAGTALVGFGVKAVGQFQALALAVGQFSAATGVSTEASSRWIEAASSIGIEAGSVQGALQKMNKAIADGKDVFTDYGVEIVRTKDGLVDSNATFQNALTTIGAIKDPTLRAKAAQEAFGKSYADVSRLMQMSAKDLQAALADVSSGQIITNKELRNAEKFRDAMDNLRDRSEAFTNSVGGELVPALTNAVDGLNAVGNAVSAVNEKFRDWTGNSVIEALGPGLFGLIGWLGKLSGGAQEASTWTADLKRKTDFLDGAMQEAAQSTDDMTEAYKKLKGEINARQAWSNLLDDLDELKRLGDEAFYANASGAANAAELQKNYTDKIDETSLAVANYAEQVLKLPADKTVNILANIQNIDEVKRQLSDLGKAAIISAQVGAGVGLGGNNGKIITRPIDPTVPRGARAAGGPVSAGMPYLVGEQGPELVVPRNNGTVIPAGKTAAMMGGSTTVNIYTNADPNSTKAALRRFDRRNGPGL